jgi:hypothetical protein
VTSHRATGLTAHREGALLVAALVLLAAGIAVFRFAPWPVHVVEAVAYVAWGLSAAAAVAWQIRWIRAIDPAADGNDDGASR